MNQANGIVLSIREEQADEFEQLFADEEVPVWRDLQERGMLVDAYECKSSRSDWQAELRDPSKADRFCQLVDRFWIVAGRSGLRALLSRAL